jgi:hypothetical protein
MKKPIVATLCALLLWQTSAVAAPKSGTPKPSKIPGSKIDARRAAEIEEMMRLRALQSRSGRGGAPSTGAPIILNGGPPGIGAGPSQPAAQQQGSSTGRKSSKERRAEAKQASAERKRLKKEQAEKARADNAKKNGKAGKQEALDE